MIRINLLPVRAARKKESVRFQMTVAGLVTFFVVALAVVVFVRLNAEVSFLSGEITKAEAEQREIQKKIGELSKIKEQKQVVQSKLDVVKRLEKGRTGPIKLLFQIEEAIPLKAWIVSFKDTGTVLTLKGEASTEDVVAAFMRGLKKHRELGRVDLIEVRKNKGKEGRDTVSFTITVERKRS